MGQQQLLLVILVTIIVGIATVVAINTFSSSADAANKDAVRQDVAAIAASSQGFFMKPAMLGGGNNSFAAITFNDISFGADSVISGGLTAVNANGTYVISARAAGQFTVTATPANDTTNTMAANILADNINWTDSN